MATHSNLLTTESQCQYFMWLPAASSAPMHCCRMKPLAGADGKERFLHEYSIPDLPCCGASSRGAARSDIAASGHQSGDAVAAAPRHTERSRCRRSATIGGPGNRDPGPGT